MDNFTKMHSFDHPHRCTTCGNLKSMPYSWNSTVPPVMCTCPKTLSLAWECPRCKKINAPWKASCDCTPFPLSSAPTPGIAQPHTAGPVDFNNYYTDTERLFLSSHDLNKNFTDK